MHTLVHEQLVQFYRGFKHDAHPMAIMVSRRMSAGMRLWYHGLSANGAHARTSIAVTA
jgi:citrate synthase